MKFREYVVGVTLVVLGLLLTTAMVQAQQTEFGEVSVVIPAGGETTVQFDTFCLEVGKDFPSQLSDPNGRAPENVLRVLKTAVEEGTVDSDPLQTQLAIWHEVEGDWAYPEDQVERQAAQELLDRAANITLEPINPTGVALDQAIADGSVSVSSDDFASTDAEVPTPDDEPYRGTGTLRITNNTDQELTVYFPFGLVFESASDSEQDMVAYATETVQEATPTPTVEVVEPTVEPTVEAMAEPTEEVEATEPATVEPAPTSTPATQSPTDLPQSGGEQSSLSMPLLLTLSGLFLLILGFFAFLYRKASSYR